MLYAFRLHIFFFLGGGVTRKEKGAKVALGAFICFTDYFVFTILRKGGKEEYSAEYSHFFLYKNKNILNDCTLKSILKT